MRTQYYTACSLDGFIAGPGHSLEWLLQFGDVNETSYPEFIREVGALAMGSHTYEWIVRHAEGDGTWPYTQPCWVFTSRELPRVAGADVRFVRGDVGPVHLEMATAASGKNLWIVGGGELAGQFHDRGLLDEIIVQYAPVTLGSGAPLLPRSITSPLRRTAVMTYGPFVEMRYEVR